MDALVVSVVRRQRRASPASPARFNLGNFLLSEIERYTREVEKARLAVSGMEGRRDARTQEGK